jgi:peptidyl-prolyl cis-trans isomerase D
MIRFLQTPGPALKIALGTILLVICGSMVITLIPGFGSNLGLGGPAQGVVATVAGQDITAPQVQDQAKQMLRQQFPQGGPQAAMLMGYFTRPALDRLILQKALVAEASRLGFRATNEEVRDELEHGPYAANFFPGGNFIGGQEYQQILASNDPPLTPQQFEQDIKEQILFTKLRDLVSGSAMVTDAEVRREFEKRNVKVKFDYAVLRKEDLLKEIKPGDAELRAFYDHNKAAYNNSIPEKRKLRYVVVNETKIQAQTEVSHPELQFYYNEHRDEFRVPGQVNVRQIVIKMPLPGSDGKVDPKGVDEARRKADDVLKQLKAGAKFEDLAKKYSDDPSGKDGGSAGWVQHFPVPSVDKIAYFLPKGRTSDVIDAGYAFVILRVDDKQDAHFKTLDEVKAQIEPLIKLQKAGQAAQGQADALLSAARSNGLDKAAADKGLEVIATDFVSRTDSLPGIGSSPQFMNVVFAEKDKAPPDVFQVGQDFAVFEVAATKPAATPTFDEIRSRVETEFKDQRVQALLSQKIKELSDRAKAGHDLKKAAKELGASLKTSDLVAPDGQVPDLGTMSAGASVAFTMKPGDISSPIDNGTVGAVLQLLERQEPSDADFPAKEDQIRQGLLQQKQQEIFGLFLDNLRAEMVKSGRIKINQKELDNLAHMREEGE